MKNKFKVSHLLCAIIPCLLSCVFIPIKHSQQATVQTFSFGEYTHCGNPTPNLLKTNSANLPTLLDQEIEAFAKLDSQYKSQK